MKLTALIIVTYINSALLFGQGAEFSFDKKNIKLPKTIEGPTIEFNFPFVNSGDKPLIINEIKVGCPCTKHTIPSAPVIPAKRDTIFVTFDTNGKIGYQDRTLEVHSNALGSPHQLRFRIMVDNKPQ